MGAEEILAAFRRDAPYLFLGAAFAAVGMVSAAFAVLRRQRDSLLICFASFAALYGLRLWITSPMLAMMAQGATFYTRLRGAVNYVTLIPALLFFIFLGLPRRFERAVGYAIVGLGCLLAAATLLFGDSPYYERINSIAIISASGFFLIRFMASGPAESIAPEADFGVIRWGLLIFVGLVVWQHSAQFFRTSAPARAVWICRVSQHSGLCCRQKYSAAGSTVEGDPKGIGGSPSYSVINSAQRIPLPRTSE